MKTIVRSSAALLVLSTISACSGDEFIPAPGPNAAGASGGAAGGTNGTAGAAGVSTAGAGGDTVGGSAGAASMAGAGGSGGNGAAGAAGTAGAAGNALGGSAGAGGNAAGGDAGAAGKAGEAGQAGAGGATTEPCPALYVNATAAQTADTTGCSKTSPLASIAAALAKADGSNEVKDIYVCTGAYPEGSLTLSANVSVHGSYDCSTWSPPSMPTVPTSIVTFSNAVGLDVLAGATPTNVVEDLQIRGEGMSPSATVGVHLQKGASPTLRRIAVAFPDTGAGAVGTDYGSVGLLVEQGSGAIIEDCEISGGNGGATEGPGSVGAWLKAPNGLVFRRNRVVGGKGATGTTGSLYPGSVGLLVEVGAQPLTIEDCARLAAGTGFVRGMGPGRHRATAGVLVTAAADSADPPGEITIRSSSVDGGTGSNQLLDTRLDPLSIGLLVRGASATRRATVRLVQSRVYGGDATVDGEPTETRSIGVRAELAKVFATSTLVHGGGLLGNVSFPRAIELSDTTLKGSFVTALAGQARSEGNANAVGFYLEGSGAGDGQTGSKQDARVELDDSLLVANVTNTYGIFGDAAACTNGYFFGGLGFAYVSAEDAPTTTPLAPSDSFGFAGGLPACPQLTTLPPPTFKLPLFEIALLSAAHVGSSTATANGTNQLLGCTTSDTCLPVLFPKLLNDDEKGPLGVLAATNNVYLPACTGGAVKSDTLCSGAKLAAETNDLNGLARGDGVKKILGAQTTK